MCSFLVSPKILKRPKTVEYGYRGYNKTLAIEVFAFPRASFQWRKNGKSMGRRNVANLTLTNVRYEDSGFYEVTAKNDLGQVRVAVILVVKDAGWSLLLLFL